MIRLLRFPFRFCLSFTILMVAAPVTCATLESIRAEIDAILARPAIAGNTWSILIENEAGTFQYYDRTPSTVRKPASNTKLYTTGCGFARLGSNYRFTTNIYRSGSVDASGKLTGNLYLIGEHDFTWSTNYYPSARTPLDQMADQLYNLGLRSVTGTVVAQGTCIYASVVSNSDAVRAFKDALNNRGISVKKTGTATGYTPVGTLYTSWQSMTLDLACKPLNKQSINVYADQLLRHIGYKLAGSDTFTAGASIVLNWLPTIGIDTTGIVMQDGSGLSHNNRFSAMQTLKLIRHMTANYPTFDDTLPIGCVDGTIGSRFCGTPGAGNVHAKTGTLTGVIALSGYIVNQTDGQNYLFSFLANNVTDTVSVEAATRDAIDDSVVVMAQSDIPNDGGGVSQIIVDNSASGFFASANWSTGTSAVDKYGSDYRFHSTGSVIDPATWGYSTASAGSYNVYAWWSQGTNRSQSTPYVVYHSGGSSTVTVNQQTNGGSWQLLGSYSLNAGANQVDLSCFAPAGFVVIADAVKITGP